MEEKKVAILIDADNSSFAYLGAIFEEAAKEGVVTYKRLYGDLTSSNLASYREKILDFAITPVQRFAYTTGKNSTDSAMIIDAMDILYGGNVDVFCIVSSDSDFTSLAIRLRESGKEVVGMGRQQTPKSFVKACSKFRYLDVIFGESSDGKTEQIAAEPADEKSSPLVSLEEIEAAIVKMISEEADDDGYMLLTTVKSKLQKLFPDFDERNYGCKKMLELIKKMNFEIKKQATKTKGMFIIYLKVKNGE